MSRAGILLFKSNSSGSCDALKRDNLFLFPFFSPQFKDFRNPEIFCHYRNRSGILPSMFNTYWCGGLFPPVGSVLIQTEALLFHSQMVEHIRWIAWNWPVKKEAAHARCIVKTAIERIKTKWILFGLFLQCGYHLNALTNIGLWTLRFNGCWITSGPDSHNFPWERFLRVCCSKTSLRSHISPLLSPPLI